MGVGELYLRGPVIGRGSTATVFLATGVASGDVFAIKSSELSRSALLQREKSLLSTLNSPDIISLLGSDVAPFEGGGGAMFYNLFLEFAPGGSLADDIKRQGCFSDETDVRAKTRDIVAGLSYLHARGVVHCDVKPGNILLAAGGRAKIGDLGCARRVADGEREVRGTPMYMAPEAARGDGQGLSSDIWSLGCSVIEMLTGRAPWPDVGDVLTSIRRIGFSGDVPEIPGCASDDARDFLGKCLRRDPAERWTADELLRHAFVCGANCAELSRISPKSTLDLSLWESMEVEEEEEEDQRFRFEETAGRIRELAEVSGRQNWDWDGEWLEVRGVDDTATTSGGEDLVVSCKFEYLEETEDCKIHGWGSLGGRRRGISSNKLAFVTVILGFGFPSANCFWLLGSCLMYLILHFLL